MTEQQPEQHTPDVSPPPVDRPAVQHADDRFSLTKKERHIGERLIEGGIRVVATLSIVFIFLIFYYVFVQASPIFFGGGEDEPVPAAEQREKDVVADKGPAQYGAPRQPQVSDTTPGTPLDSGGTKTGLPGDGITRSDSTPLDTANAPVVAGRDTSNSPPSATAPEKTSAARAREIVGDDYPILTQESQVNLSHLAHDNWQPNSEFPRYGIFPIIVGTLKTTFVALLIAIPLSILAALYSAFFAPRWVREYLKPVIEVLAAFPSVVLGYFCLMTVATIVQAVFGVEQRLNAVVGGIGLALAVIPIIYTISDDALRSVPQSLREAALALGASEWQAAYRVMLPAATPGILAAVLLGLGRAVGETMIALIASGNAASFSWNFFESVRTFAATIGAEMGEVVYGSPHYQVLFLLGVFLFIFSFSINLVTEFYIKARLIKRFRGEE